MAGYRVLSAYHTDLFIYLFCYQSPRGHQASRSNESQEAFSDHCPESSVASYQPDLSFP